MLERLALLLLWMAPSGLPAEPANGPQDITFVARCDGSRQHYVVMLPSEFEIDKPHDLLIALHGHGSDRWQFVLNARDECRATRDVAAAHAMIFVSPDYRARTSWMGPKAEADLVQIIEQLRTKYSIRNVVLVGGSMGAASALTFTAMHPDLVDGVVAMNGTANHFEYENFQDAIQHAFGGTKAKIPLQYKRRSAEYWPERFTMPVGITAGGKDTRVPPASVLRLAGVLEKLDRKVLVVYRKHGSHSTNYADGKQVLEYVLGQIDAPSEKDRKKDAAGQR